jgi:hypothetical protein
VVIDGYYYKKADGTLAIEPPCEIIARETMGLIARRILAASGYRGALLFRLARKQRCRLPDSYAEFDKVLGPRHYSAGASRGIALLTPLADSLPRALISGHLFVAFGADSQSCFNQLGDIERLFLKGKEKTAIT